jgi:hypothetical protein
MSAKELSRWMSFSMGPGIEENVFFSAKIFGAPNRGKKELFSETFFL